MFLDLPRNVIRSVARFRIRVHTLRLETAIWNPRSSPTCDLCDLCEADDDVQDEQHAIFHCIHPHIVSLRRRYESLFSEARAQDVSTFLHRNNNKLNIFCMNWLHFMSRLAVARFDWRPGFPCIHVVRKGVTLEKSGLLIQWGWINQKRWFLVDHWFKWKSTAVLVNSTGQLIQAVINDPILNWATFLMTLMLRALWA